jgi:hypothetical protein
MRRGSAASLPAGGGGSEWLPPPRLEASRVDGPRPLGDALARRRRVALTCRRRFETTRGGRVVIGVEDD